MEILGSLKDWIMWALGGAFSYLMYQQQRIDNRLDQLEKEYHKLDRTQAETSVQLREMKEDIGYIRKGMDRIIEKL